MAAEKNVVLIVLDDLRDYIDGLGGYPGTVQTPNISALARQGTLFTNAFAQAPLCCPSRTSLLTGLQPTNAGPLDNNDPYWYERVDLGASLPGLLGASGYATAAAGKVFHALSEAVGRDLFDRLDLNEQLETEGIDERVVVSPDGVKLVDEITVDSAVGFLDELAAGPSPFMLSVGLSNPHTQYIAPQWAFDLHPRAGVATSEMVPGDQDDLPGFALDEIVRSGSYQGIVDKGQLDLRTQGYLAEISFVDAQIGRLMDSLRRSGRADDTVVVLTSDHGFHLGEKGHYGKATLWDESGRVPLIVVDPGLDQPRRVDEVVSLVDVVPTLTDLLGMPTPDGLDGTSLAPLLTRGGAGWVERPSFSFLLGSGSVRTEEWRYIRYRDGSEELYQITSDPGELANLALNPAFDAVRLAFRGALAEHYREQRIHVAFDGVPGENRGTNGADTLFGDDGANVLIGGVGDDYYYVDEPGDVVREKAGGGEDIVQRLDIEGDLVLPRWVEHAIVDGGGRITGNDLDNRIVGGRTLLGFDGDDRLNGAFGRDTLKGGDGDDDLQGGLASREDALLGGRGDDTLQGGGAGDLLDGGDGEDTARYDDADGAVTVSLALTGAQDTGGSGPDTLASIEHLRGSGDADALTGDAGANRLEGGEGDDRLDGGLGADTAGYADATDGVRATLRDAEGRASGGGGRDSLIGIENLDGSAFDDALIGGFGANALSGDAGDDALVGAEGDDRLDGGRGRDTLAGGTGDDVLFGAGQLDVLTGDDGADLFVVAPGSDADRIADFTRGVDLLSIDGFGPDFDTADEVLAAVRFTASGAVLSLADGAGGSAVVVLAGVTALDASDLLVAG